MVKKIEGYSLKEIIGSGCYGQVYKATHQTNPGFFAIKVISNDTLVEHPKLEQCFLNEVTVLSKLGRCDNIVKFHEMIRSKNNHYFVYDFCNGKTLYDKIKAQSKIPESEAIGYFKEILNAFKILNKLKVIHRDLKPENILFHDEHLKVADFGLCKGLKEEESMTKTMVGSPIYMAPQVLKSQPYTSKADIWSLGVILFEMIYGYCPFHSHSIAELTNKIEQSTVNFPESPVVSEKTKSTIRQMLTKDHFRRISWVELFGEYCEEEHSNVRNGKHHPSLSYISGKKSQTFVLEKALQKQNKSCFSSARNVKEIGQQSDKIESHSLASHLSSKLQMLHEQFLRCKNICEISIISRNIEQIECIVKLLEKIKGKLEEASQYLHQELKGKVEQYEDLEIMVKYESIGLSQCIEVFRRIVGKLNSKPIQKKLVSNLEIYDKFYKDVEKIKFVEESS